MSERVLRRIDWRGGEARLVAYDGTRFGFEIERGDRALVETWDPRDEGVDVRLELRAWSRPKGAPIDEDDRRAIVDTLWSFAPDCGGALRSILVRSGENGCFVAQKWSRGDDGFLVRIANDRVGYFELGRTLAASGARIPGFDGEGHRVLRVARADARWLFPDDAPVDDVDWPRVRANLERATEKDAFDTEPGWRVRTMG